MRPQSSRGAANPFKKPIHFLANAVILLQPRFFVITEMRLLEDNLLFELIATILNHKLHACKNINNYFR